MKRAPSAGKIQLDDAIGFIVYRAHQALRQSMFLTFRGLGVEMTPEQWVVLVRLWEKEGRTQGELCADTARDKPTLSRMLDGMEERGWVVRRPSPGDARERLIFLTRAGRDLEATLVPVARSLIARLSTGVSERDLLTTLTTLRRITANLE
jgi:DNA-binding MarR family transcriptional regulator